MSSALEAVGFRESGAARGIQPFDGLEARGLLWGGNHGAVHCWSTPRFPRVQGGVLFLVDDRRTHPLSHRAHAAAADCTVDARDRRAGGGVARRFQRLDAPGNTDRGYTASKDACGGRTAREPAHPC